MSFVKALVVSGFLALPVLTLAAPESPKPAVEPLVLHLSHRLDEVRAERLEPFIENFNRKHKDIQVKLVRRIEGDTPAQITQINLATGEEYARFLARKARFKPLHQVMREARQPFDPARLSPELRGSPIHVKGQWLALPVAFSTPVLYIDKQAFRKAGLDPESPPETWAEAQEAAGKLAMAGSPCPYTTSWPVWTLIDNASARNGAEVGDARGRLAFNGLLQIRHIAMMATWHKSRFFVYFGRRDEAEQRFVDGECAMLTGPSSLFATLPEHGKRNVGVSPLPYHDDARGAPGNTLAEGASLWVAAGLKPAETRAAARFIRYALDPETQIELTRAGGFLPMTRVARAAAASTLMRDDLGGLQAAFAELGDRNATPNVRVSQIEAVRRIVEEELEEVWANRKPAKAALDDAVRRGNAVYRKAGDRGQKTIDSRTLRAR